MTLKKYERDKEAKIQRIISITKKLIEKNGYNKCINSRHSKRS